MRELKHSPSSSSRCQAPSHTRCHYVVTGVTTWLHEITDPFNNLVYDLGTIDRGVMGDFLGEFSAPAFAVPQTRTANAARPADATERTDVPGTSSSTDAAPPSIDLTQKTGSSIRPGTVYLRASLLAGFHAYKNSQRLTNRDAFLRMIESTHPHLRALMTPPASTGLFDIQRPTGSVAGDPPTAISVQFRINDYEVIDGLVATHNAKNRSHLIEVCVTYFLTNITVETNK